MAEDDLVAQFSEVTGSTPELAIQYLQVADFQIEQAMQLYFENNGQPIAESQSPARPYPPPSTQPSRSTEYEDEQGVVHLDSDDEGFGGPGGHNPISGDGTSDDFVEDDAAMARRLQEELYAGGDQANTVRAPMARTTETLVGPDHVNFEDGEMQRAILNQLRGRNSARNSKCRQNEI
jgi:UBX domain-containing protein 7